MSDFLRSYLTVGIFGIVGVALVGFFLALGSVLRPNRPTPDKLENYESGVDPTGDMWSQANIRYYVFALLFVLFDVEAVFIFPWGHQARDLRGLRTDRDGHLHLHLVTGPVLRVAQGDASMGLVESGKVPKPISTLLNMSRKYSLWVYQWGLACCAIEMGAAFGSPRYDVMRLGVIPLPASPRQADLGRDLRHRHRQDGSCCQAALRADARAQVRHFDGFLCQLRRPLLGQLLRHQGRRPDHPCRRLRARAARPRPEALLEGIVMLQERIQNEDMGERWKGEPIVID